ncbi:50S ribosomal protein L25 [Candidatus Gottesmanbacteria bacterium]|nr:50S ribosomal protein L25 [Candidatus Gottesmanbacteria bacterium]
MQREKLKAQKRLVLGKKVKKLRREGQIPATVYGKKIKSESLQLDQKEFARVFHKAKQTGLVDLVIEKEEGVRPVLIHRIQIHPVTGQMLHADFCQVDLKEKVKASVPIIAKGNAKAVTENKGVLLYTLSAVEIEALPTDLIEQIEVDVFNLSEIDQAILVKDLVVDRAKITILTSPEEVVFKIGPLITKEMQEALKAEEEAKQQAAAATQEAAGPAESTTIEPVAEAPAGEANKPEEKTPENPKP